MTEQKKVLHVITISFVINHFFGNQFNYLKKKNNNKYYLACTPSEEYNQLSKTLGFERFPVKITRSISPFVDIVSIFKLLFFIKSENIGVVVGHTPKGGMIAMIASYLAGVKERIYFRHGIIYETSTGFKRNLLKNIDKLSGKLATKVVCVSNDVKKISEKDNLNDKSKNIVLGLGTCNGVDTEEKFNPLKKTNSEIENLRKKHQISEQDFVIGYVGRLVKDKGIEELVDAWRLLVEKYPEVKLLLVGPFEERDGVSFETKKFIEENDAIVHTGFVLDASSYYAIMDVFVLPTYREGFPTVSLEASSMKVPVLTTKATGCEESVIENITGFFISHYPADIAEKIELYIQDNRLQKTHGVNGRKFVEENFRQEIVWDCIRENLNY